MTFNVSQRARQTQRSVASPLDPDRSALQLCLFQSQVDAIDVSHLKRHVLANVGLLMATLYAEGGQREVVQVSMVTQLTPEPDGTLIRSVFSPLD